MCCNFLLRRVAGGQQLSAQRQTGSAKAIGEKAEVTDADEAFGQHVQKEAAQELGGGQGHLTLLAAVGVILPAEGDALSFKGQQSMIGNGHAMGVATEIAQHLQGAAEGGLGVDHPVVAMETTEQFCELLGDRRGPQPGRRTVASCGGGDVSGRRGTCRERHDSGL